MAIPHAHPFEVIDLAAPPALEHSSTSLLRTPHLQLLRLVLSPGHTMPQHHVAGEITLQCLEGVVTVSTDAGDGVLRAGQLVMLPGGAPHSLHADAGAVVLLTLLHPAGD